MQERSQRKGAAWMSAQAAIMAAASAVTMTLMSGCKPAGDAARPLAPVEAASANPAVSATLLKQSDEVLARYRQMIVLMDGEAALKPAERDAVRSVGMLLFHDMQESIRALGETAAKSTDPAGLAALSELLDRIEQEPSWFDADRLAFKEFLTQLSQQFSTSQSIAGLKLAKRAGEDLSVLAEIENAYEQELRDTFGRFAQRGIVPKREKWTDYVAKLKGLYARDRILKDYATILPDLQARPSVTEGPDEAVASTSTAQTTPTPAAAAATRGPTKAEREFFGRQLPPKTVLLTFDDGPHPRYTDEILEILKRYQAPAVFFELGRNLGSVDANGKIKPGPGSEVAKRVLAAGHPIANHSFSHGVMSKFELDKVRQEASSTEALLDAAGRDGQALFRFPYGARNDAALGAIEALKLRSMMWNVDSLDWSDPIPKSIAARVLGELGKQQRGIVLFHDIHARTVEALPLVLDQLKAEGYKFAAWKDGKIVAADTPAADAAPPDLAGANLYRDSVALVIGIDQYKAWPRLQHAVRDARAIQETLQTQFGFRPENVTTLTDGDATRANILRALNGMARKGGDGKLKRDDRVFVFFAGHGSTRKLPSGRDVGYIIPVDAGTDDLQTDAIAMPQLQELSEALPAKHAFFVIDACYSGLGLTRGGAPGGSANFVRDNARRMGRQMMTAGGADQQVADDGPGGHSVFTWTLLQALSGKADLNGDGLITATELAAYVAPAVSAIAHQTPAFGSLPGSEGGEFIFELASTQEQALSGDSNQLDAKTSALAKQADDARNAQLQPVAQASAPTGAAPGSPAASATSVQVTLKGLDGTDTAIATSAAPAPTSARIAAQRANDRGLQLYKERRYDEAEAAFTEALKLQPKFALAANNLGFIYYKRDKPAEAARWYRKAIEMDGSRALAHLNLGDALLRAGDDAGAQAAYQAFIELSPKHARAAELKAWIEHPDSAKKPEPPR